MSLSKTQKEKKRDKQGANAEISGTIKFCISYFLKISTEFKSAVNQKETFWRSHTARSIVLINKTQKLICNKLFKGSTK